MNYIQIGRLEIFVCKWDMSYIKCHSGCNIVSLGWIGFTWLAGDCID